MHQPKRFIQVGLGGFGGYWVRDVMPRLIDDLGIARAVAVVDMNADTFPQVQHKYHLPPERCYTDMERAFAENPADFVIIVVPPKYHESVVDLALGYHMDVLSEKPIADTMEACARVFHKVQDAGRKMAVTMSHRFDQDKQTLEAAIKSDTYGPLHYIVHRFTCNLRHFGDWGHFRHTIPDTLLIEGTVHHFDILRALSGSNAETVYAQSWNPAWGEYAGDSTALVSIKMENGVRCFYEGAKANATTLNGWGQDYLRAECRDATLELDRRQLVARHGDGSGRMTTVDLPLLQQPAWMNPWLAERFVNWLCGGEAPPNQLADNIQCAALLFAAVESAHSGQPVQVQEFLQRYLAR